MSEIFVDTSMFKALIDEKDEFHTQSMSIWKSLKEESVGLVTSNYILDETFTLVRARLGIAVVKRLRDTFLSSSHILKVIRVTIQDEADAWKWFVLPWSKLSFTDCISFAIMERLHLKRVATFDRHFRQATFDIEEYL